MKIPSTLFLRHYEWFLWGHWSHDHWHPCFLNRYSQGFGQDESNKYLLKKERLWWSHGQVEERRKNSQTRLCRTFCLSSACKQSTKLHQEIKATLKKSNEILFYWKDLYLDRWSGLMHESSSVISSQILKHRNFELHRKGKVVNLLKIKSIFLFVLYFRWFQLSKQLHLSR